MNRRVRFALLAGLAFAVVGVSGFLGLVARHIPAWLVLPVWWLSLPAAVAASAEVIGRQRPGDDDSGPLVELDFGGETGADSGGGL